MALIQKIHNHIIHLTFKSRSFSSQKFLRPNETIDRMTIHFTLAWQALKFGDVCRFNVKMWHDSSKIPLKFVPATAKIVENKDCRENDKIKKKV